MNQLSFTIEYINVCISAFLECPAKQRDPAAVKGDNAAFPFYIGAE